MNRVAQYLRELSSHTADGWNRFWFTPSDPATLGLIRILAGAMLFYTHLVWSLDLAAFFGPGCWLNAETASAGLGAGFTWSHLWWCESPIVLWTTHMLALAVCLLLMVGLFSRTMSVLGYLIAVSYAHRVPFALFGLDQVNAFLAMYLMLGHCGAAYSVDRWRAQRRSLGKMPPAPPSVSANVAVRLMQLHLCVLYLFAGVSKLQGPAWWDGTALWKAMANLEYQSIDMTWLAGWPLLINVCTHVTIVWEVSYCALIWPRLTRPIVLLLAVPLHLGIALCLGMTTFGVAMLIANLSFVSPALVREMLGERSIVRGTEGEDERLLSSRKSAGKLKSRMSA